MVTRATGLQAGAQPTRYDALGIGLSMEKHAFFDGVNTMLSRKLQVIHTQRLPVRHLSSFSLQLRGPYEHYESDT